MEGELGTKFRGNVKESAAFGHNENGKERNDWMSERKIVWGKGFDNIDLSGKFVKEIHRLPSCCSNADEEGSPIQEFFRDAHVLVTGGTGFMGKVLVEKLLASCPGMKNLHLLIREKKGLSHTERMDALFKDSVFTRLQTTVPNFRDKVVAVNGDTSKLNFGLSESDYKFLTENVSIIFHGAATVRFDEKLGVATTINIKGVSEMIRFARNCKSLKSILHISTAYANCTVFDKKIAEQFYPAAYDYKQLINLVEKESEESLEKMAPDIIKPWPNSYAFTKQIAEDVIQKEGQGLPIGIFRPAIIISSYKEPMRGWSDSIHGIGGIIVGAGTGFLRVLQTDPEKPANVVPVDLTVNGAIAAAWKVHQNSIWQNKKIEIFNYVSSTRNPVLWGEFAYWNTKYGRNWPTTLAIWWNNSLILIKNRILFLMLFFLCHTLPSYIADAILYISRKEPKMRKIYQKIGKYLDILNYFALRTWTFTDENVVDLWTSLTPKDREIYPFDIAEMDWDFHAQAHLLGLRIHLVKDDIHTLPDGRKKWKRLHIIHRTLQMILIASFCWIIYWFLSVSVNQ